MELQRENAALKKQLKERYKSILKFKVKQLLDVSVCPDLTLDFSPKRIERSTENYPDDPPQ